MQFSMSRKTKSWALKLMTLLILETSFTAKAEEIRTIQKNDKAPYAGILMPDDTYREILVDASDRIYLKSELDRCLEDKEELQSVSSYSSSLIGFALGLVGGIALMVSSR